MRLPISAPALGAEEREAVAAVVAGGQLAAGPQVTAFEREFAEFCGAAHAVAVSSGTAALHLGLVAAGVRPGMRVAVPTFTFAATANAVLAAGAVPVFVDVGDDCCVGLEQLEAPHVGAIDAIVPVHLYGQLADLPRLRAWAAERGAVVIEDACQAHSARDASGALAGAQAPAAYSFYATKNMTTGEGGALVTSDDGVAESVRLLRNHGMRVRYEHERFGLNLRLTDLQAAIGRVQLRRLPEFTARRRANAAAYDELLADRTPLRRHAEGHVFHQYVVRVPARNAVRAALAAAGIGADVYYPIPLHHQPAFAAYSTGIVLPRAERLAQEVLALPVHPGVTTEDARGVASALLQALRQVERAA
ncbi:MAG: DegT/DnrJ/EryC1/StrS aminotransferase family protein [Actinomycetota bacterium]|nr:DegT/DnrJ/EryC1/StrS aminotransferase family protein [Actinomycetota bacterium]